MEVGDIVVGVITEKVKGGFYVKYDENEMWAFLPGSLASIQYSSRSSTPLGLEGEFMVIHSRKRKRIILSRKAVLKQLQDETFSSLNEGDVVTGTVKSQTRFGVFVDLGNDVCGLIYQNDEENEKFKESYTINSDIRVEIVRIEGSRISLDIV